MRRNRKDRKILGGVRVKCEITGLNQDRLISELKKRDFSLYDIKKVSNRKMYISVLLQESENFFAITEKLCYNVKKVALTGKGLSAYKLVKNFGLVLGAIAFLAVAFIANDFILSFSYSGSGNIYAREVEEYLSGRGVTKYSRFSSIQIDRLEDEILADNPNLTFVSVTKNGNTLALYLTLKKDGVGSNIGKATNLLSEVDGVVESIKVYRGTPCVRVGDTVKVGDLLVDGWVDIKDQRVETGVLACVTIASESSYSCILDGRDKQDLALMLATEKQADKEIIYSIVTVKELSGDNERFIYEVTLGVRQVVYSK